MDEILPGLLRVPVPLPFRPRVVHAYLARTASGRWMLVDGGVDTSVAWAVLSAGVAAVGGWKSLSVNVVTHMHLDHVGLAQRVRTVSSVPLAMSALDADRSEHAHRHPEEEEAFRDALLLAHGVDPTTRAEVAAAARASRTLAPFAAPDHRLADGDPVPFAGDWCSVATPGHTAGHLSLFREEGRVLIAGDAVLPRVTPTIGVNRQRPDPIGDYHGALDRIEALCPRLILGGHGEPIHGVERVAELRRDLRAETERVGALLGEEPRSAWEISLRLYAGRDLPAPVRVQALRETLAHLEHLVLALRAERATSSGGGVAYARSA